jgi:GntR family transcriptional regulator
MDVSPHYRPLYRQVYDYLVKQIADSAWRPGDALPPEQTLAEQLRVSHGTVRKALDALATENLVERRQGKGTFVLGHTQERALFRFFRMAEPGGARVVPTSVEISLKRRPARAPEAQKLGLQRGDPIVDLLRTRWVDDRAVILERNILPLKVFPDLDRQAPLPNTLYAMFHQKYGINVVSAEEELRAELATADDAQHLPLAIGSPLLHVERLALALDGSRVEWRVSRCDTSHLVYAISLA